MKILIKWLVSATAILISAYLIPGIDVGGIWTALVLAVILALINIIIRPILVIVTLPINILTLGLFTFVINALLILLSATIVKGFDVDGFLPALLFAIILSIVNYFLSVLVYEK